MKTVQTMHNARIEGLAEGIAFTLTKRGDCPMPLPDAKRYAERVIRALLEDHLLTERSVARKAWLDSQNDGLDFGDSTYGVMLGRRVVMLTLFPGEDFLDLKNE